MSNQSHQSPSTYQFVYQCVSCGGDVILLITDKPESLKYRLVCLVCGTEYAPAWQEYHYRKQEQTPDLLAVRLDPAINESGDFSDNQSKWMVIQKTFDNGAWEIALCGACELLRHIIRTNDAQSIKWLLPLIGSLQLKALRHLFQELDDTRRCLDHQKTLLQNAKIRETALRQGK